MHSVHYPIIEKYKSLQYHQDREQANSVALCGHLSPDGDCLGSMVALGKIFEKQGKTVHYYTPSPAPKKFDFLQLPQTSQEIINPQDYDLIIATDVANIERSNLDGVAFSQYADKFHMIDHHYGNNRTVGKHLLFDDIKSCCEIIAVILMQDYQEYIDSEIATLVLMGILTDSGGFTWSGDRSSDMYTASVLVGTYGAKKERLQQHLFRSNTIQAIQYVGELLGSIQQDRSVIFLSMSEQELEKRNLESDDVELALFTMTSIDHDGVFIQFKIVDAVERPMLKCGFRTKSHTINVSDVAGLFGGGGHQQAAGARIWIQGDPHEMIQRIISKVNEYLTTNDNS